MAGQRQSGGRSSRRRTSAAARWRHAAADDDRRRRSRPPLPAAAGRAGRTGSAVPVRTDRRWPVVAVIRQRSVLVRVYDDGNDAVTVHAVTVQRPRQPAAVAIRSGLHVPVAVSLPAGGRATPAGPVPSHWVFLGCVTEPWQSACTALASTSPAIRTPTYTSLALPRRRLAHDDHGLAARAGHCAPQCPPHGGAGDHGAAVGATQVAEARPEGRFSKRRRHRRASFAARSKIAGDAPLLTATRDAIPSPAPLAPRRRQGHGVSRRRRETRRPEFSTQT